MSRSGWLGRNGDGDLQLRNNGFDSDDIPPYSEEWFIEH